MNRKKRARQGEDAVNAKAGTKGFFDHMLKEVEQWVVENKDRDPAAAEVFKILNIEEKTSP